MKEQEKSENRKEVGKYVCNGEMKIDLGREERNYILSE